MRLGNWEKPFLKELAANGGCVAYAAEAVGISRPAVYARKLRDEKFAVDMADVLDYTTEALESSAYKRAVEGDTLLTIFLLKARKPWMYRDNYVPKGDLDEEQLALLADVVKQAMYESGISASQQKVFTNVLERRLKAQEGVLVESTAHDIEEDAA